MEESPNIKPLKGLYEDWFLDYASYVILDRAIPHLNDGLKPVQRRILHSLKEMDDGRYNKVANVIGHCMKYHPHGDASIGDALVQLGQKDVLIDKQGNWGDTLTGDKAAAPRYIEARLTPFSKEVVFNNKTTEWQLSYDGRNEEPVTLPVKFPLLLLQGAEGIAVGLSTKILPHNFNELIDASIKILQDKGFTIYPDFQSGGFVDVSDYKDGERGGKIKVRAHIEVRDPKTLVIKEIPYSTATGSLIDSIVAANEKGKVKVKKIDNNTAAEVEIVVHLQSGTSPDVSIDALYAFTQCEVSISPNFCVIHEDKPCFINVKEALVNSVFHTKDLLKKELEIELNEKQEKKFFSSLEKIFIEEKIYRKLEDAENEDYAIDIIDFAMAPFKERFIREVTTEDYLRLLEVKMKRITKYDSGKADDLIQKLDERIAEIEHHLRNLTEYTIDYFKSIKEKYGKGKERKTKIKVFDKVEASQVAAANEKLYINRKDGFIGTGLKKDEYVFDCSAFDDIVVLLKNGTCMVTKVSEKTFVGKNIIHIAIFQKDDLRTTYNMIYEDTQSNISYIKRFHVTSVTRDKAYQLAGNNEKNKVHYLSVNPNGEVEKVKVELKPLPHLRKLEWELDFASIPIKGRGVLGNIVVKNPIKKITLAEKGASTLGKMDVYFDKKIGRINMKQQGGLLDNFMPDEKVLAVFENGSYRTVSCEPIHRLDEPMRHISKYKKEQIFTAVYYDGERKNYFIKRFSFQELTNDKIGYYISHHPKSKVVVFSDGDDVVLKIDVLKGKSQKPDTEIVTAKTFIAVKGISSLGNRLSTHKIKKISLLKNEGE